MSGKRGQASKLRKLTLKEKANRVQRAMKRDRERKLRKKYKIPMSEPVNRTSMRR